MLSSLHRPPWIAKKPTNIVGLGDAPKGFVMPGAARSANDASAGQQALDMMDSFAFGSRQPV